MNRQVSRQDSQQSQYHQSQQQRPYHQYQQHNQRQGGWIPRGAPRQRGRPRGGYRPPQGGNQPNHQGGKPKNTLKFENDYDFEEANTHFEELRSQLGKVGYNLVFFLQ